MKLKLVFTAIAFIVCLGRPVDAQVLKLYEEAESAFATKDYAKHAELAEQILRTSRHPYILYRLAQSYAATEQRDKAIAVLQELEKKGLAYDLAVPEPLRSLQDDARFQDLARQFAANRKTIDRSSTAFVLGDRELIPEGIAVDPRSGDFFVGSLAKWKVVKRKRSGAASDFVRHHQDGLWTVLGIKVEPNARELWVCSATEKEPQDGDSGIFVFDLGSGALRRKFVVDNGSGPHLFNDIALDGRGGAYFTDSKAGKVYAIRKGSDQLEELIGDFIYPNGIVLDGEHLFVADFGGLTRIHLPTKARRKIDDRGVTYLEGIDGLSLYKGTLIAVQDSGNRDDRVVRFSLDASKSAVERVEVLQSVRDDFVSPTTGTVYRDHYYYIANSFLRHLEPDMTLSEPEKLKPPLILKISLR
jgi:sugar lactone lactonase YvrE